MKQHDAAARFFHPSDCCFAGLLGSFGVEQNPHLLAGTSALRERIGHATTERAILPEKGFKMHRFAGRPNPFQQDIEESAVLQNFDGIAGGDRAERQSGERRH